MELTQIRLLVTDFPAVYRFYRDVLGLTPQFDNEEGPYAKLSPARGAAAIALQAREQVAVLLPDVAQGPATEVRALVALRVDDLDKAVAGIRQRGGTVDAGPAPMGDRLNVAYVRDPEGNVVELQEWLTPR
ncbi:VOC family protein [Streptacidiphilus fuscans]|uniref:VOC family protein n=1 Tax=Streptacidiphilus fuscans TaxID=2789292 RepID=A0A931B0S4_9ACTN|nr:VOC family protein [Streptacidiphilus fuscans]MBF9068319.1 VOC family protein [Streptacidiphilus fuscans]